MRGQRYTRQEKAVVREAMALYKPWTESGKEGSVDWIVEQPKSS